MNSPDLKRYKQAAQNRKARHSYEIESSFEAGIILTGTEVKSLRLGQASLQEAHAGIKQGEIVLFNCYIPEYKQAGAHLQHEVRRPRALLIKKREREKLIGQIKREGITLVPLSIYFNARGIAKIQIGIATGKKQVDKRATIKDRDWKRDQARLMKSRSR